MKKKKSMIGKRKFLGIEPKPFDSDFLKLVKAKRRKQLMKKKK